MPYAVFLFIQITGFKMMNGKLRCVLQKRRRRQHTQREAGISMDGCECANNGFTSSALALTMGVVIVSFVYLNWQQREIETEENGRMHRHGNLMTSER